MSVATLLLLADSRFPTGAHAHSAGVEPSHGRGDLRTIADLAAQYASVPGAAPGLDATPFGAA